MSEKRFPVRQCARCGQDHDEIVYKKFECPVEDSDGTVWDWWGTCPVTGDPILMAMIERDKQPDLWEKYGSKTAGRDAEFPSWQETP